MPTNNKTERAKHALVDKAGWTTDEIKGLQFSEPSVSNGSGAHVNGYKPDTPAQGEKLPRFHIYTAAEAEDLAKPQIYRVEKIAPEGSSSMWTGDAGSGKTVAATDLGVCVSAGVDNWLGLRITQTPVLFIDEESGRARFSRRLVAAKRGHGLSRADDLPFFFTTKAALNLRPNYQNAIPDVELLKAAIKQCGAGVVFIDALADIMAGGNENSVEDVQPVVMAVSRIAEETGASIILIHHNAKHAGNYRGSSAIPAGVDLLLNFKRDQTTGKGTFESAKTRDVEPFSLAANFMFTPTGTWLEAAKPDATTQKLSKSERYVMGYLLAKGVSTIEDIENNADACTPEAARRALYSLTSRKLTRRADEGRRGTAASYNATDEGRKAVQS